MKPLHNVRLHSGVCVGHAPLIQSQTSREDKDEKTQENYSAPRCYRPSAELEVRDRTVLKTPGEEERPFTILYTGSRLSIGICPRHRSAQMAVFPQRRPGEFCCEDNTATKISITSSSLNMIKAVVLKALKGLQ